MDNPQNSKLWAGYFLLLCLFMVVEIFFGPHSPLSLVNSILTGISLVGLWGYISQKAIGQRFVWAALFFMQLLGALAVSLLFLFSNLPVILVVVVLAFTFPLLLALFRYAFRSQGIWSTDVAGVQ